MTIAWTDVGPRDGLQNLAASASTDVKVRLVRGLLDAGVPRVEATSFVSPRRVPQLADAAEVLTALGPDALPRLRVLVPNLRGLELAMEHSVRNVVVTVGATDSFNRRNVNRTVDESFEEIARIVDAAGDVVVDVALSVAFGCPFEGWVDPDGVRQLCAELAALGCREICVADTIGVAGPLQVEQLCGELVTELGAERVALHVHDTRGLGVANVLAAYGEGVESFEGSVGGLGGCPFAPRSTGNVCSEDALAGLYGAGADIGGIDLEALCAVAERLGADLGLELPGRLHRAGMWHPDRLAIDAEAPTAAAPA